MIRCVREFVVCSNHESHENRYTTNYNEFTVFHKAKNIANIRCNGSPLQLKSRKIYVQRFPHTIKLTRSRKCTCNGSISQRSDGALCGYVYQCIKMKMRVSQWPDGSLRGCVYPCIKIYMHVQRLSILHNGMFECILQHLHVHVLR